MINVVKLSKKQLYSAPLVKLVTQCIIPPRREADVKLFLSRTKAYRKYFTSDAKTLFQDVEKAVKNRQPFPWLAKSHAVDSMERIVKFIQDECDEMAEENTAEDIEDASDDSEENEYVIGPETQEDKDFVAPDDEEEEEEESKPKRNKTEDHQALYAEFGRDDDLSEEEKWKEAIDNAKQNKKKKKEAIAVIATDEEEEYEQQKRMEIASRKQVQMGGYDRVPNSKLVFTDPSEFRDTPTEKKEAEEEEPIVEQENEELNEELNEEELEEAELEEAELEEAEAEEEEVVDEDMNAVDSVEEEIEEVKTTKPGIKKRKAKSALGVAIGEARLYKKGERFTYRRSIYTVTYGSEIPAPLMKDKQSINWFAVELDHLSTVRGPLVNNKSEIDYITVLFSTIQPPVFLTLKQSQRIQMRIVATSRASVNIGS
jgi:chemotaxis protein histidine kinase CheA